MSAIIQLTNQAPVRVREEEWPIVASAERYADDASSQARVGRTWECHIYVRRHEDGRALVYGTYTYTSAHHKERDIHGHAGTLLDGDHVDPRIPLALKDMAWDLLGSGEGTALRFRDQINEAWRSCVADLPPVDL